MRYVTDAMLQRPPFHDLESAASVLILVLVVSLLVHHLAWRRPTMTWIGLISSARVATGRILRGPGAGLTGGVVGSWAALRSARTPGASTPGTRTTTTTTTAAALSPRRH